MFEFDNIPDLLRLEKSMLTDVEQENIGGVPTIGFASVRHKFSCKNLAKLLFFIFYILNGSFKMCLFAALFAQKRNLPEVFACIPEKFHPFVTLGRLLHYYINSHGNQVKDVLPRQT